MSLLDTVGEEPESLRGWLMRRRHRRAKLPSGGVHSGHEVNV